MTGPTSAWSLHRLGNVSPEDVSKALANEGDSDLAARILDGCAEDIEVLVTVAAGGTPIDANIVERIVNKVRIAAALTSAMGTKKGVEL